MVENFSQLLFTECLVMLYLFIYFAENSQSFLITNFLLAISCNFAKLSWNSVIACP